jgi:hypothetical protein
MKRRALLGFAATAAGAGLLRSGRAVGQGSLVRVTREEPITVRTEFDPGRPPPEMPPLTPPEAGVCKTTYELSASVTYSAERLSGLTARLYVDGLDIVTRLRFDIYTAQGAPPKGAHEEGHRAIGEHYYDDAARIAEDIGRRLIGVTFDGTGVDQELRRRRRSRRPSPRSSATTWRACGPQALPRTNASTRSRHGLEAIEEADAIALAISRR